MSKSIFSNKFQLIWVLNITFCHTYHILSTFYFIGISDFPQNGWLTLQLYAELIVIIDLIMRFYIMYFWPEVWDSLWLLHDTFGLNSKTGFLLNLLGSLPLIFIVVWSTSDRDILGSLLISLLRIPKLLRFREIWQISKTYLKSGKEGFQGYFRVFRAIFSLIINTHIIGWIWLVRLYYFTIYAYIFLNFIVFFIQNEYFSILNQLSFCIGFTKIIIWIIFNRKIIILYPFI